MPGFTVSDGRAATRARFKGINTSITLQQEFSEILPVMTQSDSPSWFSCSHGQLQLLGDAELFNEDGHLVVAVLPSGGAPGREVQTDLKDRN